ncbi:hypothetical protein D3C80_2164220 [compost metagenome]
MLGHVEEVLPQALVAQRQTAIDAFHGDEDARFALVVDLAAETVEPHHLGHLAAFHRDEADP